MNNNKGTSFATVITVTRALAHAADVDEHEQAVHGEHDENPHRGTAEKRNDQRD
jgi:hypothetical protein